MKTVDYLDAIKAKLSIRSDYGVSLALGVTRQAISRYRRGGGFDAATCVKVAELLGIDPMRVIADSEIERGSTFEGWKRWAAQAAALAFFCIAPFLHRGDAEAREFDKTLFCVAVALPAGRQRRADPRAARARTTHIVRFLGRAWRWLHGLLGSAA